MWHHRALCICKCNCSIGENEMFSSLFVWPRKVAFPVIFCLCSISYLRQSFWNLLAEVYWQLLCGFRSVICFRIEARSHQATRRNRLLFYCFASLGVNTAKTRCENFHQFFKFRTFSFSTGWVEARRKLVHTKRLESCSRDRWWPSFHIDYRIFK